MLFVRAACKVKNQTNKEISDLFELRELTRSFVASILSG